MDTEAFESEETLAIPSNPMYPGQNFRVQSPQKPVYPVQKFPVKNNPPSTPKEGFMSINVPVSAAAALLTSTNLAYLSRNGHT